MIITLIKRYKHCHNNSKKPENVQNKQCMFKSFFSRNPVYQLTREGHFPHISVATIAMFPGTSLISSN